MGGLAGVRVIELAGQGPGPFCATLLADHGADVLRIVNPTASRPPGLDGAEEPMTRGRRTLPLDLKLPAHRAHLLELVGSSDVLLEGFRPGVAERLGVGPEVCLGTNPRLVYTRITGWGQGGPLAPTAGHDITYVSLTGALAAIGPSNRPVPPLNLVGDYAGGALFAALGTLIALVERAHSGQGQVVDAAMVDGAAYLMTPFFELAASGSWNVERASNSIDGGAPFYDIYETADGGHVAVGALEPQFFAELVGILGLADDPSVRAQYDRSTWPAMRTRFQARFAERTRAEWTAAFAGTDACAAPVLHLDEVPRHPHHRERRSFVTLEGGTLVPAPAPRLSRTPASIPGAWP